MNCRQASQYPTAESLYSFFTLFGPRVANPLIIWFVDLEQTHTQRCTSRLPVGGAVGLR